MSWVERFQAAVAKSRTNSAQPGLGQASVEESIGNFFRQFRSFLGLQPKDMCYLMLNNGQQPYPVPVGETKPDIQTSVDPASGEQIFYAAAEVKLLDQSMGNLPIWVRVAFKDSVEGWIAVFRGHSAPLGDENRTHDLMTQIGEEIESKLTTNSIPPVKLGF